MRDGDCGASCSWTGLLALHWLALARPAGQQLLAWLACGAVSVLVGAIALRTVFALARGELMPQPRRVLEGADPARAPVAEAA